MQTRANYNVENDGSEAKQLIDIEFFRIKCWSGTVVGIIHSITVCRDFKTTCYSSPWNLFSFILRQTGWTGAKWKKCVRIFHWCKPWIVVICMEQGQRTSTDRSTVFLFGSKNEQIISVGKTNWRRKRMCNLQSQSRWQHYPILFIFDWHNNRNN